MLAGCAANHAIVLLNPGHSLSLVIGKAENALENDDTLACFGFLKRRKSSCTDLVRYGGGVSDEVFSV